MRKCKENSEYRIIKKPHDIRGVCYIAQKRKRFLGIGYWSSLSRCGTGDRCTDFGDIEGAKSLIEDYKSGKIVTKETVVGYY